MYVLEPLLTGLPGVGRWHQRPDTFGLLLHFGNCSSLAFQLGCQSFPSEEPQLSFPFQKHQCQGYQHYSSETALTCRNRSMMAMHMYRVSCRSLNLEWTWTSQSTRMARIRPFISLPSKKCGLIDCKTCWCNSKV